MFAAIHAQEREFDRVTMNVLNINQPVAPPGLPWLTIDAFLNSLEDVVVTPRASPGPGSPPAA